MEPHVVCLYICYFTPAISCVSHYLESLFFRGSPGRICLTFLDAVVEDNVSFIGSFDSPSPPGSRSPMEVIANMPVIGEMCRAFRFLDEGEVLFNGWPSAIMSSSWG